MPKNNNFFISRMAWNFSQINNDTTEIFIYDAIADKKSTSWWSDEEGTEVTPLDFNEELKKVTTQNICVRINSRGGDVFAAEAIRTAIRETRQKGKTVTCKVDGFCGSAATGVSAACEKTSIPASAYFMIHDPHIFSFGYYGIPELKKDITMLEKIKQGIIKAYSEKTGKSKEEISDLMTAETWYTGEEAVENGFCDELMFEEEKKTDSGENPENFNMLDISMYKNLPLSLINRNVVNNSGFSNISKAQNKNNNKNGGEKPMEIKNIDELRAAYPDLVKQAEDSATSTERKRIQDIENITIPGFDNLVSDAKFTNPINSGDLAVKIIAEQKKLGVNYLNNRDADVKNSNLNDAGSDNNEGFAGNGEIDKDDEAINAAIDKISSEKK